MYINNKLVSIIYKFIGFALCLLGILIQTGVFKGNFDLWIFNYYTLLSNVVCLLYFLISIIYLIINYKNSKTTFLPMFKGSIVMCITVTMLVYHFLLAGSFKMSISDLYISNIILHYIVPFMMIFDYILFDKKGVFKSYHPLIWIITPHIYFIYALIRAEVSNKLFYNNSRYPYDFIDIDKYGIPRVLLTVVFLTIGFIILGYILYFIDSKMKKKTKSN